MLGGWVGGGWGGGGGGRVAVCMGGQMGWTSAVPSQTLRQVLLAAAAAHLCPPHLPSCPPPGRKGKTGIATTFINKNQSEQILLDLKHLLKAREEQPGWAIVRAPAGRPVRRMHRMLLHEAAAQAVCVAVVQAAWIADLNPPSAPLPLSPSRRKQSSGCRRCCRRCTTRWRSWRYVPLLLLRCPVVSCFASRLWPCCGWWLCRHALA